MCQMDKKDEEKDFTSNPKIIKFESIKGTM